MAEHKVHPVDEKLPTGRLAALGLQHVLVMDAGAIAGPLIVGRALKLSPEVRRGVAYIAGFIDLARAADRPSRA